MSFFIGLGVVVVLLLGAAWLYQRKHPGTVRLDATDETRALRDRVEDEHVRNRLRNPNGQGGGFGAP